MINICTIYKYTNKINGKVYIGQTWSSPKVRAGSNGRGYDRKQSHFYAAIQKYGWNNFVPEIVCYAIDQQDANYWESHFIRRYASIDRKNGYNIRDGGSNGPLSEESKKKISIANTGKFVGEKNPSFGVRLFGDQNPFFGKHHSNITKNKLSADHKGKPSPTKGVLLSEEHKNKISDTRKGNYSGVDNPFFGKHHSDDTKKKISAANFGKTRSEERNKKRSDEMSGKKRGPYKKKVKQ